MIIHLNKNYSQDSLDRLLTNIKETGLNAEVREGKFETVIDLFGDTKTSGLTPEQLKNDYSIIKDVMVIQTPYKRVARRDRNDKIVNLGNLKIRNKHPIIIAGPCSVEDEDTMIEIAKKVKKAGANMLRGGAYKPRSSSYSFQGAGLEGLKILAKCREETGLPVVTEATGLFRPINGSGKIEHILENVVQYADMIQIGARNMKNYELLKMAAHLTKESKKPILLKRGEYAKISEFLNSAEYIADSGNDNIILCLRGTLTNDTRPDKRYQTDVDDIPRLMRETHLPIIYDPSHACGFAEDVPLLSKQALMARPAGLIVEAHVDPVNAKSDAKQTIDINTLKNLIDYKNENYS